MGDLDNNDLLPPGTFFSEHVHVYMFDYHLSLNLGLYLKVHDSFAFDLVLGIEPRTLYM